MATRKRASSRSRRSSLVGRAVSAGRKAFREAESRVPPDIRRQLERSIKDGQKTLKTAIDQLQVQVRRTAKQADVDKALKRLEGLSKQVQKLAGEVSSRGAARATSTTRRASTARGRASGTAKRVKSTAKRSVKRAASTAKRTARAAPSSSSTTARRTAPRRSSPRRTTTAKPEIRYIPPAPEPGPMPEPFDAGGNSV